LTVIEHVCAGETATVTEASEPAAVLEVEERDAGHPSPRTEAQRAACRCHLRLPDGERAAVTGRDG